MKRELFDNIFDNEIFPMIREMDENNSLIELKNIDDNKTHVFREYNRLKDNYKDQIFGDNTTGALLDRHKIASCICGAFLKYPFFDTTVFFKRIRENGDRVNVYFYYTNELISLIAATKYLSFFMISENKEDLQVVKRIMGQFPLMPKVTQNKRGFWNSVLFNLSQVQKQIGIDHYDMYAYAMFFYWMEYYFYITGKEEDGKKQ